jgi:hypothetical protein
MPSNLDVATQVSLGSASVPLLGQANVWVDALDSSSVGVVQSVVLAALEGTAPGQLEVIVFDEGLSGLAAPFEALGEGAEKAVRILDDEQGLRGTVAYLRRHIQGVKNVMRGEAPTLVEYRRAVGYPVEGYKLVVLSTDYSLLPQDLRVQLAVLFKAGPAAGVSFVIHSITEGINEFLLAEFQQLNVWQGEIEWQGHGDVTGWVPPAAANLVASAGRIAGQMARARMDPIAFTDVQDTSATWQASSAEGIQVSVGRYGRHIVTLTLGDELNQRHNMLVTGAVGQGKSNLISVIVHSLCQRYSPAELELYLLDFKEGVTLQAFFDRETGRYLPHARVLGLEADREFGLSVFRHLHQVYKERMRIFKAAGVQSIREYRRDHPEVVLPRIVLVIDEFQMMFAEHDRVSEEIADLLVKGVRLFRACGVHVILASQTIGGNMALMGSAGEGLFGQVPIRVALKNSLAESHATLSPKNDAATHLRVGQAIVNEDYGELQANRKTTIAWADPVVLERLRLGWWEARGPESTPPSVFEGSRKRSLPDDVGWVRQAGETPRLFLGSRIEVEARPLSVPLAREVGRNAVVLGSGAVIPQLQNMAVSLALQRPCQFAIWDALSGNAEWDSTRDEFTAMLQAAGSTVQAIGPDEVSGFITDTAYSLASRDPSQPPLVILGLGLDRIRTLPLEFQDLAKDGPATGVHLLGWWLKLASFREHVGYGGEANFDIRLALKLDASSAKDLMGDPLLQWHPEDNRMIAWDVSDLPEPVPAIPYSRLDGNTVALIKEPS